MRRYGTLVRALQIIDPGSRVASTASQSYYLVFHNMHPRTCDFHLPDSPAPGYSTFAIHRSRCLHSSHPACLTDLEKFLALEDSLFNLHRMSAIESSLKSIGVLSPFSTFLDIWTITSSCGDGYFICFSVGCEAAQRMVAYP